LHSSLLLCSLQADTATNQKRTAGYSLLYKRKSINAEQISISDSTYPYTRVNGQSAAVNKPALAWLRLSECTHSIVLMRGARPLVYIHKRALLPSHNTMTPNPDTAGRPSRRISSGIIWSQRCQHYRECKSDGFAISMDLITESCTNEFSRRPFLGACS
jgi:hypothetical protein